MQKIDYNLDHISVIMRQLQQVESVNLLKYAERSMPDMYDFLTMLATRGCYNEAHDPEINDANSITYMCPKSGKRLVRKLGRYLNEFFEPDTKTLQDMVSEYKFIFDDSFYIARTANEIYDVYQDGPSSCMSYDPEEYQCGPDHYPTDVYADSDLAVAYLRNHNGKVSARAVIYPEEKIYYMVYGEASLLERKLQRAGYVCDSFVGATINLIYLGGGTIVGPYIDGEASYGNINCDDDGVPHSITLDTDGDICFDDTSGVYHTDIRECSDCGSLTMRSTVVNKGTNRHRICSRCLDGYTPVVTNKFRHIRHMDSEALYINRDSLYYVDGQLYASEGLACINMCATTTGEAVELTSDMVELASHPDGTYARKDDCVLTTDGYVLSDDPTLVNDSLTGMLELRAECTEFFYRDGRKGITRKYAAVVRDAVTNQYIFKEEATELESWYGCEYTYAPEEVYEEKGHRKISTDVTRQTSVIWRYGA